VPRVMVQPIGVTFDVPAGETVFATAVAQGYRWPTVCGGQGSCHMCHMRVLDGTEGLADIEPWEAEGLAELGQVGEAGETIRLACQAKVRGDVTVYKRGVKLLSGVQVP
jgi:ferredoxin, 2Fe-2S